jgi:hypothetical protein
MRRKDKEQRVFQALLRTIPCLEHRLMTSSDDEVCLVADLVYSFNFSFYFIKLSHFQIQKGVSGARSDDTKSLKSVIIDWITPPDQPMNPPLPRNVKTTRGFNHDRTGFLLCPVGLDWTDIEWVPRTFFIPHGADNALQNTGKSPRRSISRYGRAVAYFSVQGLLLQPR